MTQDGHGQRRLRVTRRSMSNAAGTYHWIANYGGDANNNATTNGCNGANENVVVEPAVADRDDAGLGRRRARCQRQRPDRHGDAVRCDGERDGHDHVQALQRRDVHPGRPGRHGDEDGHRATASMSRPRSTSTRRARITGSRTTVATRTTTRPRTAATRRTRTSGEPARRSNREVSGYADVRVGDTASFTLTVTNTGDVPLSTDRGRGCEVRCAARVSER